MNTFSSTTTVDSKSIPGVKFTYKIMTAGVRDRLRFKLAELLDETRDLRAKLQVLDIPRDDKGELKIDDAEPRVQAEALKTIDAAEIVQMRIDSAYFDECFVGTCGLAIDGVTDDFDANFMRERGPETLYLEMLQAIGESVRLRPEERANLASPTTSAAQVGGQTSGSTAASAPSTDGTKTETVAASRS